MGEILARTGVHAVIYCSPTFWKNYLGDTTWFAQNGYDVLWVAHWTAATAPTVPGGNWGGEELDVLAVHLGWRRAGDHRPGRPEPLQRHGLQPGADPVGPGERKRSKGPAITRCSGHCKTTTRSLDVRGSFERHHCIASGCMPA